MGRLSVILFALLAVFADGRVAGNVGRAAGSKIGASGVKAHRWDRFQMMLPKETTMIGDTIVSSESKAEGQVKEATKKEPLNFEDELWIHYFNAMDVLA